EVERGEVVLVDADGMRTIQAVEPPDAGALCIFEFFYLARPDTRLDGIEVHGARVRMGERLAQEAPAEADLVLPIPDSGTPAAIGQCFYGIDLADPDEMVAAGKTVDEVRGYIGATSLAYLSHEALVESTRRPESDLCRACLTRQYPTEVPAEYAKLRFEATRA